MIRGLSICSGLPTRLQTRICKACGRPVPPLPTYTASPSSTISRHWQRKPSWNNKIWQKLFYKRQYTAHRTVSTLNIKILQFFIQNISDEALLKKQKSSELNESGQCGNGGTVAPPTTHAPVLPEEGPAISEFVVSVSAVLETTGVDHASKARVMGVVNRWIFTRFLSSFEYHVNQGWWTDCIELRRKRIPQLCS